jgi:transcription elongation factor Elf1
MAMMYEALINGLEDAKKKINELEAELAELKKKEVPMEAFYDENYHYFTCPKCGIDWGYTCEVDEHKYCGNCGQRLEFREEEYDDEVEE